MVKLTKIYTRTGDQGNTQLAGGQHIKKSDLRVECMGDVDELNSWIGKLATQLKTDAQFQELYNFCIKIQHQLFNLGAELCVLKKDKRDDTPCIHSDDVSHLENHIDLMNNDLPNLTSFILPGGNDTATTIHITRAVCRRCERHLFKLNMLDTDEALPETALQFINRLSDWLFVAARFVCQKNNVAETLWNTN